MNLNFDIPTPPNCVECPFGSVDKLDRYGGWIFKCRIPPGFRMPVTEAINFRSKDCPGKEKAKND